MSHLHGRWEALTAIRTRSGLSIRRLADTAGLSPSTVCELEAGKYLPSARSLRQLAEALRVPVTAIERRRP